MLDGRRQFVEDNREELEGYLGKVSDEYRTLGGFGHEHALYLDFYGIEYHLTEYWKTPKSERRKMRKARLAEEKP